MGLRASPVSIEVASLPRRHIISAAGALAAACVLARPGAGAARKTADAAPFRGSIAPARARARCGAQPSQPAADDRLTVDQDADGATVPRGRDSAAWATQPPQPSTHSHAAWRHRRRAAAAEPAPSAGRQRLPRGGRAGRQSRCRRSRSARLRRCTPRSAPRAARPRSLSADRHQARQLPVVPGSRDRRDPHQQRARHRDRPASRRGLSRSRRISGWNRIGAATSSAPSSMPTGAGISDFPVEDDRIYQALAQGRAST